VGLKTDTAYGKARIDSIEAKGLVAALAAGEVPVVAGFQGVTEEGRVSTLGRGGSDTSAVALAAALSAQRCDIYTDVDGVYTTDPRMANKAHKLKHISYEEMLELASVGAKVLQTRSVEMAMRYNVPVQVLSSFALQVGSEFPGTLVSDEENESMEKRPVTGIAYSRDEAQVTLRGVPDRPGVAAAVFGPLGAVNVNVDMIVQNMSGDARATDLTFTVAKTDLLAAKATLEAAGLGYQKLEVDEAVAKVSVVGMGMKSHAHVAALMFKTLAEKGINIRVISTSEIKISVLISASETETAVRALHAAYGLDDGQ
jgi:aspartate kinase